MSETDRVTDLARAQRTPQGQVRLRNVETGEVISRWPVDAKAMVTAGDFEYVPDVEKDRELGYPTELEDD